MKGYIVYHYDENQLDRFPVFDFVSNDRVVVMDKFNELGGMDAGYYIAQVSEMK